MSRARPRGTIARPREKERELLAAVHDERKHARHRLGDGHKASEIVSSHIEIFAEGDVAFTPLDIAAAKAEHEAERIKREASLSELAILLNRVGEVTGRPVYAEAAHYLRVDGYSGHDANAKLARYVRRDEAELIDAMIRAVAVVMKEEKFKLERALDYVAARTGLTSNSQDGARQRLKRWWMDREHYGLAGVEHDPMVNWKTGTEPFRKVRKPPKRLPTQ